ncbi:hypothetical protein [Megavirus chiliensis]|uniref:Uncharacterized protein n=3 Tax=Megamimivirinae TaxID=3044648 RepID=A0A2L2DMN0_MIMIV|nr:hypothetical protein MegaChil _gp0571 [Megavirus chiliensis]AEQ32640.1 hypothetical protein [Megavirus chiliensis]AEX61743.1 hypothetical protein c7_L680 [Megavirus courdo7]AVG47410.1 hypothetical protein [Acanthamoeba polyphaga mimivirus]
MNNIVCHIVGLDEIHKKRLIKYLNQCHFIDLDNIQQKIHNKQNLIDQKNLWSQMSQKITILKNQQKNTNTKTSKYESNMINQLIDDRNNVKKTIHDIWKHEMSKVYKQELNNSNNKKIIIIGFNIFPKDYRVKMKIEIQPLSINLNDISYNNTIIYDINPFDYASNQIKFYLNKYQDKIIRGTFPLNLLKQDYLKNKYEKITDCYSKQGYVRINKKYIIESINQFLEQSLIHQQIMEHVIDNIVYVATFYKAKDIIQANPKLPIYGFITKQEALNDIKPRIKKQIPIYIYQVHSDHFQIQDGKLVSIKPVKIIEFEPILLTI